MRGVSSLILIAVLLTSTAIAPPGGNGPPPDPGLPRACEVAASNQPCLHANVIPDTTIGPGSSRTYEDGDWTVEGTIHVQTGGSLHVLDATFTFLAESGGIVADEGATVEIIRSTLEEDDEGSPFELDLASGSAFTLNDSTLRGGEGVKLATDNANVSGNLLTEIPLALFMDDVVEVTIHHNHFLDNEVAVNQTGGITTLDSNRFEGGEFCVRDWLADPTIENNVFRGCHVGIYHQRSNSVFRANDMMDDAHEPGVGIIVEETNSPIIEGNTISNYGTGIIVRNATAYIRNNTISDNVGDGVRIEANTQPLDIQGNDIFGNGGDGIELAGASQVQIFANTIHDNDGHGVLVGSSTSIVVNDTEARSNGADGFRFTDANVTATDLVGRLNANGLVVTGSGQLELSDANMSENAGNGFHFAGDVTATLARPVAIANGGHGLLNNASEDTSAYQGWWEANGGAGIRNNVDFEVFAECGYWGSASGPTTEENPNGTGDEVEGLVDWSPYRTSPALTSCTTEILYVVD